MILSPTGAFIFALALTLGVFGVSRALADSAQESRSRGANEFYDNLVNARALSKTAPLSPARVDQLKRTALEPALSEALTIEKTDAERSRGQVTIVERPAPSSGGRASRRGRRSSAILDRTGVAESLEDLGQAPSVRENTGGGSGGSRRMGRYRRGPAPLEPEPVLDATGLEPVLDFSSGRAAPQTQTLKRPNPK